MNEELVRQYFIGKDYFHTNEQTHHIIREGKKKKKRRRKNLLIGRELKW
jgi:hypothetical protein